MRTSKIYLLNAADGMTNVKLFQEFSVTCVQNLTSIVTDISPPKRTNTESTNNNNKLNTCLKREFIHHTFVINSIVVNMRL